jgi:hypothetical protein
MGGYSDSRIGAHDPHGSMGGNAHTLASSRSTSHADLSTCPPLACLLNNSSPALGPPLDAGCIELIARAWRRWALLARSSTAGGFRVRNLLSQACSAGQARQLSKP